jgi:hypothetical protein
MIHAKAKRVCDRAMVRDKQTVSADAAGAEPVAGPSPVGACEARATGFVVRLAFLGLFLGPIVLIVFYDLLVARTRLGVPADSPGVA